MRELLILVLCCGSAQAAGLGLLTARGSVKLNGFRIWDNGTVVEGMLVASEAVGAIVTLNSGAEVVIAPASRIRFSTGVIALEAGSVMVRRPGNLRLHATGGVQESNGVLLAGPRAAAIPALLNSLSEKRPLSQRP